MAIFVSYCSIDRKQTEALLGQIGTLEHDVTFEAKTLGSDVTWQEVFTAIEACDLFVLVLTPYALISGARRLEYEYACALDKRVLVVMLESVSTEALSKTFRASDVVDYREANEESTRAFAEALTRLPPPEPLPKPLPLQPNWLESLNRVRLQIDKSKIPTEDQTSIIHNLSEFLERRETFEVAASLLMLLKNRSGLSSRSIETVNDILSEIGLIHEKARSGSRSNGVAAIGLGVVVVALGIAAVKVFPPLLTNTMLPSTEVSLAEGLVITPTAVRTVVTPIPMLPTNTKLVPTATVGVKQTQDAIATEIALAAATQANGTLWAIASSTKTSTSMPSATVAAAASVMPTSSTTLQPIQPSATPTSEPLVTAVSLVTQSSVYLGIEVENSPQGVQVVKVSQTAAAAGVRIGDYILAINLEPIDTRDDFMTKLRNARPLSAINLRVRRSNGIATVQLRLSMSDFAVPTSTSTVATGE